MSGSIPLAMARMALRVSKSLRLETRDSEQVRRTWEGRYCECCCSRLCEGSIGYLSGGVIGRFTPERSTVPGFFKVRWSYDYRTRLRPPAELQPSG